MREGLDYRRLVARDWFMLFEAIIARAREFRVAAPHVMQVPGGHERVVWEPGHPTTGSPSFREASRRLAAIALRWLDPPPSGVTLKQLGSGFSGAYVVKAQPQDGRVSFVLKIDEDPEKLKRELGNYRTISSLVPHENYLPILGPDTVTPVTLTGDWWAAFLMPYEGNAKPLIEHSDIARSELTKLYKNIWEACLFDLYGTVTSNNVTPAAIGGASALSLAKGGLHGLHRYLARHEELNEPCKSPIKKTLALLDETSDDGMWGFGDIRGAPWVERVHGDLNCRNVLYRRDQKTFKLIDFPNITPNCLAVDFTKAEAELVLIMMDWATGKDCDFSRLDLWATLTLELAADFSLRTGTIKDAEARRVMDAAHTIREVYGSKADPMNGAKHAYRLYLLARVLRYISYSDLSIAKRFLALIWAGQLVDAPW